MRRCMGSDPLKLGMLRCLVLQATSEGREGRDPQGGKGSSSLVGPSRSGSGGDFVTWSLLSHESPRRN